MLETMRDDRFRIAMKTILLYAPNRTRNGVGVIAVFQAFALAASLLGILPRGSLGLAENLSRHENSFITYTDYLGIFTIGRGFKPLAVQPARDIATDELFNRKHDEAIHLSPNYAELAYRCGIFCISLIRSPPVISPSLPSI
jgi:hypothetical protein